MRRRRRPIQKLIRRESVVMLTVWHLGGRSSSADIDLLLTFLATRRTLGLPANAERDHVISSPAVTCRTAERTCRRQTLGSGILGAFSWFMVPSEIPDREFRSNHHNTNYHSKFDQMSNIRRFAGLAQASNILSSKCIAQRSMDYHSLASMRKRSCQHFA